MGIADLVNRLRYGPMPVSLPPPSLNLPEKYLAIKFYTRPTWPDSLDLKHWIEDLVGRIQPKLPVVSLATGLSADDHVDVEINGVPSLVGHVTPQNNLAVQSAVIAKAQAFLGTYGGTMQLAVKLGIPSAGFYNQFKDTAYGHKMLTEYLGTNGQRPAYVGRPADASFIAQLMTGIQV